MTQQRWRLDGQTALITGASAGIGLAIAHELAGFGADLMIVGRDIDMLETARDELLDVHPQMQVHALAADVSDDEDRRQILDWVEDHSDGLHILVNNCLAIFAGQYFRKHLGNTIFDVGCDFQTISRVEKMAFHLGHVFFEHFVSLFFDMKNGAVYIDDNCFVHDD